MMLYLKAIFLVGGLGSSPYTKQTVEQYAMEINPQIRVYQPLDAYVPYVLLIIERANDCGTEEKR
jgi:hypothetical protein